MGWPRLSLQYQSRHRLRKSATSKLTHRVTKSSLLNKALKQVQSRKTVAASLVIHVNNPGQRPVDLIVRPAAEGAGSAFGLRLRVKQDERQNAINQQPAITQTAKQCS